MEISKLSHFIPLKFSHFSVIGLLFVLNISSAIPADAPGIIASEPLQTSTTAKPNLMFIIDNSISMNANDVGASNAKRMDVAKAAAKTIIEGLGNVRVGLAEYNTDPGATIVENMADLSSTYIGTLKTAIDNMTPTNGGTPLAHSLRDIGRYFANGNSASGVTNGQCGGSGSADLIIHPGRTTTPVEATVGCTTLLSTTTSIETTGPVTAWCQRSFAILLTDGLARGDTSGININTNLRDYDWDCTNASNTINSTPATAVGYTCSGSDDKKTAGGTSPSTSGTYAYDASNSNTSDYADDVAQALFEIDLQPALDDSNGDEVKNNLTTYVIAMGASNISNDALLKETALQGGGEFIYADSAAELVSAFSEVTTSIIEQTGTSSSVTFNSSTLSSQSAVYQALFNTATWSGELNSYPIDGITGAINTNCIVGTDNNCWKAADKLDAQDSDDRFILVAGDNSTKYAVEFTNPSDYTSLTSVEIPQALVEDLCSVAVGNVSGTSFPCLTSDTGSVKTENSSYIEDLIDYLRGDNSEEIAASSPTNDRDFRTRISDLGDIVNSSPVFIGAPQLNWPKTGVWPNLDGSSVDISYKTWKSSSAVTSRPEVVYVASNDGMLHGFRAEDSSDVSEDINTSAGEEVFAFIPSATISTDNTKGLHYLANSDYSHRFYNDLTPTISDVYMDYKNSDGDPTGAYNVLTAAKDTVTADWRTILLGSQGGGGKSLYLLDVTDPLEYTTTTKQNAKKLLLWEFSDSDDSSLGYTYSRPTIAMMNNGKFAAIFGNGYNSSGCNAELFVVFLEGGLDGTWTENTDYFKYDTDPSDSEADCNGMSTPAVVDLDGNGTADRVYAGDLQGNMWVFDFCAEITPDAGDCDPLASGWGIAHADPLMYANVAGVRQPITSKPVVSRDPNSNGGDDLIIVFGTGQYLTDADKSTTGLQRMYGVLDYDALNNSAPSASPTEWNYNGDTDNKWAITVFGTNTDNGILSRVFASTGSMTNKAGWRIDLPDSGERMVVNPKIRNNIVFFNTLIPDSTTCSYGGSGWILSVNLIDGGAPPNPIFDLDGSNTIGDAGDTTTDGIPAGTLLGEIPAESTFLGDNQYTPGSDGTINVRAVDVGDSRSEGRMSWKELYESL
ncbi:MAG: VWA domain-containing protein [Gammaproteobacteria bacterium]|nr:VWA domain-containing protein [Gammaproteobacteria bacterium]